MEIKTSDLKSAVDFFEQSTQTVALPSFHATNVIWLALDGIAPIPQFFDISLSAREQARAERFRTRELSAHFRLRRQFRRYCAAQALGISPIDTVAEFAEGDKGRPFLADAPDISFSFSSCRGGLLAGWSRKFRIGLDIEDLRPMDDLESISVQFFTPCEHTALAELNDVARTKAFLTLWCLKEAALKSVGEGIGFGLNQFAFSLSDPVGLVAAPMQFGGVSAFHCRSLSALPQPAALVCTTHPAGV